MTPPKKQARKRVSFEVHRNNSYLTVYPYTHPKTRASRWRYGWRERESDPWRYVTCKTKDEAETSAWEKLGELSSGGLVWSGLDPETRRFLEEVNRLSDPADYPAVLAFLQSRKKSAEIVTSVGRFMDWKVESAGEETRHLANVRRDLEKMAKEFSGRSILDISPDDLKQWWDSRVEGRKKKTRNEVRGNLVAFWNWAVWDGIHPKDVTPADKLPRVELDPFERFVWTPEQFLHAAAVIQVKWRGWLVLGGLCGMRPEEIAPPQRKGWSKKNKRGIRCEEIDFSIRPVIRVPEVVSKVDGPRIVPVSDGTVEWLAWAGIEPGMTGPVCLENPSEAEETKRLGELVFGGAWPQDALRHSYASYRNAIIRNLPQVAEEMGTSETMLNRNYHNPKTLEEGQKWFGMRPSMIRYDPIECPKVTKQQAAS